MLMKLKTPKGQTIKEVYGDINGINRFVITQDITGECYLYSIDNGILTKIKQAKNPIKINEYATEQILKGME